jgi:hypothetical protein
MVGRLHPELKVIGCAVLQMRRRKRVETLR